MQQRSTGPGAPPRVLVPLAPGFEKLEAVTIVAILRRADPRVLALLRRHAARLQRPHAPAAVERA
jgi:hypothetical protein